jgi:auxin response factor
LLLRLDRGEGDGDGDGELRVGIRRAARLQKASPLASVLPSESMHMGVIATATHAMLTRTIFSIYFTPRFRI